MIAQVMNLISIARKGGYCELGEDSVGGAAREHHARLILVASDASDHTFRHAENLARTADCPIAKIDADKQTFGFALGRSTCALAAVTDPGLALSIGSAIGTLSSDDMETLRLGAEKQIRLRREAKAHENNRKHKKK